LLVTDLDYDFIIDVKLSFGDQMNFGHNVVLSK